MSYNVDQQTKKTARVRRLFVAALALGCAFGTVPHAQAQHVTPPTSPPSLRHRWETPHFWWATRWGLKAIPACPQAQALPPLPGPSRPLAPKPPFFRASSVGTFRSSPTSSAQIQDPPRLPQDHCPSAARRGRAPSIAARCGDRSCIRSPPAPTPVVLLPGRLQTP